MVQFEQLCVSLDIAYILALRASFSETTGSGWQA